MREAEEARATGEAEADGAQVVVHNMANDTAKCKPEGGYVDSRDEASAPPSPPTSENGTPPSPPESPATSPSPKPSTTKIWYYSSAYIYSIPKSYEPKSKICDFDEMLTRFRGHFHTNIDIDPEIEVSVQLRS